MTLRQPESSTVDSTIEGRTRRRRWRTAVTVAELVVAVVVVVLDLLIPTLVLLALAGISLAARQSTFASLGLRRHRRPGRLAIQVLGLSVAWTLVMVGLLLPALEHLTGLEQDVSPFVGLRGNPGMLALLLLATWLLAAVGEELAYRGYVLSRARELLPPGRGGAVTAVVLVSLLFGLAHTEQGVIGVTLAAIDGVFYSILRYRCQTLWAGVLAHGFINTIGLVSVFLVGPIRGLW